MYENEIIEDIRLIKDKKLEELIFLKDIKDDLSLIKLGINMDDNQTCFYGFNDVYVMATCLSLATKTYGIFLDYEFIGITSFGCHHPKDLTRQEICLCLSKDYRSLGIGSISMQKMVDECFKEQYAKSIHLSIREDNIASRKVATKLGFIEYTGYKKDSSYIDLDGNIHKNIQYILKKNANS